MSDWREPLGRAVAQGTSRRPLVGDPRGGGSRADRDGRLQDETTAAESLDGGKLDATDGWLRRLRGLLTGRHNVTPAAGRELVDETAAHLQTSGADPLQEFGPADEYALRLAGGAPRKQPWWRRPEITQSGIAVRWLGIFLTNLSWNPDSGNTWLYLGETIVFGGSSLFTW